MATFIGIRSVVAYYPALARALRDVKAAIFLAQLIYWTPRTRTEAESWIYKTSGEIEIETGLVYEEQLTARKKLLRLGIMEERHARLEHRLYFRVKGDELDSLWKEVQENSRSLRLYGIQKEWSRLRVGWERQKKQTES